MSKAKKLTVPDGHFLNSDGPIPLIVRDEDGEPVHAVVKGALIPHDEFKADLARYFREAGEDLPPPRQFAVTSAISPPSAEEMAATLELRETAKALHAAMDDADRFFVHDEGPEPLIVEHATGEPKYRVKDGGLVPIGG